MADVFDFYVYDNRSIVHTSPEPIMQEDKDVAVWRFRIPKVLNNIDMSAWSWWFVYVNAKNQKFSELLSLNDDIDDPENFSTTDYSIGYGISKTPGGFTFALEAINTEQGGEISGEWHTRTYTHTVTPTLQGNQAEYAETESDIISALMQEVRTRMNQVIGGATPLPVNLKSLMTDHDKVYLYTGSEDGEQTGYWYYWNGTNFVPGGVYGAGDPESVQGYVEDWLSEHPEATTTVHDGSITEAKLANALKLKTINNYVTPEMFGAVGDGTTDDTLAFRSAFASEKKVLIPDGSYNLADNIFVDESQLVDNRGTFPSKKMIVSKSVTSAPMPIADRKSITLSALGTKWGSGVAYNGDTGKLLCCGWDDNKIAQIDFATLTVDRTVTLIGLEHGNDLTYNPTTGKYYATPTVNNGEIIEINTDLTLNNTITISGMNFAPSQISYDPDNDIYYVGNSQYTYAVDANFNIIKLLSTHSNNEIFANAYEHINAPASQGSAVYNGQFLGGVWLGATGIALERGRSYARLVTYDYNSGAVKNFYDFPMHINAEEFEAVEVIDGNLCLFSCRFGTLFITTVYPDKIYLSHDTTKYPYYLDAMQTANNYCTATDVARVRTFVSGNSGVIKFNLNLSTALPASTNNITIGNLGVRPYDEFLAAVPSQKNQGNLLVDIKTNGDIVISNPNSGVTLSGFFRTVIPILIQ